MSCSERRHDAQPAVARTIRVAVTAASAGLACAAIAACGASTLAKTIAVVPLERSIARSVLTQQHVNVKVSCPPGVREKAGGTFSCYALLQVGRYRITVSQVDGRGDLRWHARQPLTLLNTLEVERRIALSIRAQRKVAAKVTCPTQVLQAAGVRFTCTAKTPGSRTVKAGSYPFEVTEVNNSGYVTYIGR